VDTGENRSNPEPPPELSFLDAEDLFAELLRWEDQLKDIDFDRLEGEGDRSLEHEGDASC